LELRGKYPKSDHRRRRREGIRDFSRARTAGPEASEGPKVVERKKVAVDASTKERSKQRERYDLQRLLELPATYETTKEGAV
jgi:hypothetical protein